MALYRVARGNRIRLEFEDDLELDRDAWHVLRVEHADGRIRVSLGGIGVMRARDRAPRRDRARRHLVRGGATAWFDDCTSRRPADRER